MWLPQVEERWQDLCPGGAAVGSWQDVGRERRPQAPGVLPAPGFVCGLLPCHLPFLGGGNHMVTVTWLVIREIICAFYPSNYCQRAWSSTWWCSELNRGTDKPSDVKFSLYQALNNSREAAMGLRAQEPGELSGDKLLACTLSPPGPVAPALLPFTLRSCGRTEAFREGTNLSLIFSFPLGGFCTAKPRRGRVGYPPALTPLPGLVTAGLWAAAGCEAADPSLDGAQGAAPGGRRAGPGRPPPSRRSRPPPLPRAALGTGRAGAPRWQRGDGTELPPG